MNNREKYEAFIASIADKDFADRVDCSATVNAADMAHEGHFDLHDTEAYFEAALTAAEMVADQGWGFYGETGE